MIEPTECERFGPLVELLRDGALEETSRRSVEAHLKACAACSDEERFWSNIRAEALFPEHRFDDERLAREGPWLARPRSVPVVSRRARVVGWGVAVAAAAGVAAAVHISLAPREAPVESLGSGQLRDDASEKPPPPQVEPHIPAALEVLSEGDVTLEGGDITSAVETEGPGR